VASDLVRDGWSVLARNWRGGGAELDLVVELDGRLRFVEVKARTGSDGLESLTGRKQRKLASGARAWLQLHGEPVREAAFLVALVDPGADWDIEYIDDAFSV
jgi:putative endonuclease